MDAENTYRVFDWLWTSGQLSTDDIGKLPSLGVNAVVNLAPPDASNALAGEAERITSLGIAYVQIPVAWDAPLPTDFSHFAQVLKAFEGDTVWVHCAKNMRVSAFVYLYRKCLLGEGDSEASFPMREIWQPNEIWQAFISKVAWAARS